MSTPDVLCLSHWDAAMPVIVPANVVTHLTNYHILGIRFLYNCLQNGYRGAILNEEVEMNPCIQVCAFLNALNSSISIESPAVILCTSQSFGLWHYNLSNYAGNAITVLSEQNCEDILHGKCLEIILSTIENLKWLKGAELDFFTVIIDNLDVVINKKFVKQIKGQYHIGITTRNFLRHPDQKLLRNMLLWANPGSVAKLEEFCQEDDDHLKHNRYAYGEYWLRLSWSFCDSFKKPTEHELQSNQAAISDWSYGNNLYNLQSKKRTVRKRKRESIDEAQTNPESIADVKVTSPSPTDEVGSNLQAVASSQETIIYDYTDDCPLLMSIMNSDVTSSKAQVCPTILEEPKTEKSGSSRNILLSIMDDDFNDKSARGECANVHSSPKNDILSMLFSDSE